MNVTSVFAGVGLAGARVRPLDLNDLPDVLELERLGYSHPWTEGVFRDCFKESYRLWGLVQEGRLLGYAVVSYLFDEAHLLNLCVHPGLRGLGAGRKLLRHAASAAASEQLVCMILEVRDSNKAAAALYQSEGFSEIGRRPGYYPGAICREDAIVMALRFT
ncbi:ribosomal protein S18-alanine N-acetyltransferase [Marinobacter sp. SS5-14b]|uniref:ribosomal protein S18-alanine N-acetyltransferase n=1 Tax=Marinobacter sp. SS5-14b TaxID=3050456 RepID=UPI0026DF2AE7|nr:ribosomal protein S18-alanine N-acetyltransferase [Marinobacter sp. SS5-14b]